MLPSTVEDWTIISHAVILSIAVIIVEVSIFLRYCIFMLLGVYRFLFLCGISLSVFLWFQFIVMLVDILFYRVLLRYMLEYVRLFCLGAH